MSTTYTVTDTPVVIDDLASTSVSIQNTGTATLTCEPLGQQIAPSATVAVPGWSTVPTTVRTAGGMSSTAVVTLTGGSPATAPGPGGLTLDPNTAGTMAVTITGGTWYSNEGLTSAVSFPQNITSKTVLYPAAEASVTVAATVGSATVTRGYSLKGRVEETFVWPDGIDTSLYPRTWATPAASTVLTTSALAAWTITAVDCTAGSGARSLPLANSVPAGVEMCAKKADTSANALTISRAGSDVIAGTGAGATTKALTYAGEAVVFVSNGTNKWTVRCSDTPSAQVTAAITAATSPITPVATGTATLVAGAATVSNTSVTANAVIRLSHSTRGGTPGAVYVSAITGGASFVITSTSGTDTSKVRYEIVSY
jgi:hypothetical protein